MPQAMLWKALLLFGADVQAAGLGSGKPRFDMRIAAGMVDQVQQHVGVQQVRSHASFCPFMALRKASIFSNTSCAHGETSAFLRGGGFLAVAVVGFADLVDLPGLVVGMVAFFRCVSGCF